LARNNFPKILLIDDNANIRSSMKAVLKKFGHKLDVAANGKEGLAKCEAHDYDLVLLDIDMPGMDGFGVFRYLRSREKTRLLPEIIFFSDMDKLETEGLQLGACDFIAKSHLSDHPREFVARVEAHLKITHLTRQVLELERSRILKATVMSVEHEIRNPLIAIGLILDKAKDCPNCGPWYEKGKQSAQRISDALDRLGNIQCPVTTEFLGKEEIDTGYSKPA